MKPMPYLAAAACAWRSPWGRGRRIMPCRRSSTSISHRKARETDQDRLDQPHTYMHFEVTRTERSRNTRSNRLGFWTAPGRIDSKSAFKIG